MSDTAKTADALETKIAQLTERLEKVSLESLKTAIEEELKDAKEEQSRRAASVMKQVGAKLTAQVQVLNEIRAAEKKAKELVAKIDDAFNAFLGVDNHKDAGNIAVLREKLTPLGVHFSV